jgi:hypothetical protein
MVSLELPIPKTGTDVLVRRYCPIGVDKEYYKG